MSLSSGQQARLDPLEAVVDASSRSRAHVGGSGHQASAPPSCTWTSLRLPELRRAMRQRGITPPQVVLVAGARAAGADHPRRKGRSTTTGRRSETRSKQQVAGSSPARAPGEIVGSSPPTFRSLIRHPVRRPSLKASSDGRRTCHVARNSTRASDLRSFRDGDGGSRCVSCSSQNLPAATSCQPSYPARG